MSDKIALQLRLDSSIHSQLKTISEQEMRSLNSQIEYFLTKAIEWYQSSNRQMMIDE